MEKKRVLEIIRMTNHNGPGFRTLVLFKGCPQTCTWCSTPESQLVGPEIGVYHNKCSACGTCVTKCPAGALKLADNRLEIDRERCILCGACERNCAWKAIKFYGKLMTAREIVQAAARDKVLYKHSGGGVTFSGGEPLYLQPEFNYELFKGCRDAGISVGVQTCGSVPWRNIEPLLPLINFFLWDLKHMDPEKHTELTGISNELALENCRRVAEYGVPIHIRVPVIPGISDSLENLRAMCEFVKPLPSIVNFDLLPIHHLGKARYEALDRPYLIDEIPLISDERMQELQAFVISCGVPCGVIG